MDMTLIIAALAFVMVGGVGFALAGGQKNNAAKRAKAMASRGAKQKNAADTSTLRRRQNMADALKELSDSEKQSRKRRISIKGQLLQAGMVTTTLTTYWLGASGCAAVLAIAGFFIHPGLIAPAVGAAIGLFGVPRWYLGFMVAGRQKKFAEQLADAIDIIVRGVKSGLPLNQCLRIIGEESPEPLKGEFRAIVDGQAMGMPLEQNLQRLYENMPLPEVNFFIIVLTIQQKTGGNLSESLGNLSTVLRARKLMREKVKALSSEAKASAMIIGSLPFIVFTLVYIIRPGYMTLLFTTPTGNLILLASAVMMTMGIMVMRSMINFKF